MEVKLNELLEYKANEKVLYASNSKKKAKLYILLSGSYMVEQNGEEVLKTMQPYDAIETFNELKAVKS